MNKNLKACLFLQRRFALVGNEIAALLKERHGVSEFCAYVSTRDSYEFLRSQKDVAYTSLLFDEDVHDAYHAETIDMEFLKKLEDDYGCPTLWQFIENDRVVRYGQLLREYPHNTPPYTHEEMLRIVQATAKKVLAFLEKEKPDFVVFSVVGGIGPMLLYHIAKKKGIRTFAILSARVHDIHILSEHFSLFTELGNEGKPDEKYFEQARAYVHAFRAAPAPYTSIDTVKEKKPSRSRQFKFLAPHKVFGSVRWQWRLWTGYFSSPARHDYSTIKPWHIALDRLMRKMRVLIGYEDLYDDVTQGEEYVYFPLHFEPEMVMSLYAPVFGDQLWTIKQIAKSLPVGYKLYVKEHLAMFGYRKRAFYKELKKIPNVVLVRPYLSSFDLIQNARPIMTLTSTVGWEALLLKKPVITFGDIYYNALSASARCHDIENLPSLVRAHLDCKPDEEELATFLAHIFHEGAPIDLTDIWERERSANVKERRNELIPITDAIFKKASTLQEKFKVPDLQSVGRPKNGT